MTIAEVARRYGMHHQRVRDLIEVGWRNGLDGPVHKLRATRVGKRWDVAPDSLDAWAAANDAAVLRAWGTEVAKIEAGLKQGQKGDWVQYALPRTARASLERLAAAGRLGGLAARTEVCESSGRSWLTFSLRAVGEREPAP